MPLTTRMGKDGTVLALGSANYLGRFTSCVVRETQTIVERHGPQDDYDYISPTRLGLEISTDSFIPTTNYANALRGLMPPSSTAVNIALDLVDGGTIAASGYLTSAEASVGDGPTTESFVFRATGPYQVS